MTTYDAFLELVIDETTQLWGVKKEMLFTKDRKKKVKYCRWMVWYIIAGKEPKMGYKNLAKIFGNFDHSTVIHALSKFPEDIDQFTFITMMFRTLLDKLQLKHEDIKKGLAERAKHNIKFNGKAGGVMGNKAARNKYNSYLRIKLKTNAAV